MHAVRTTLSTLALAGVISLALSPFAVLAQQQNESEQLRTEIRAALLEDTRTSELSGDELSAMVEMLASSAESQGIAYDFVPPPPVTFTAAVSDSFTTPWGQPMSEAVVYGVVLISLAIAMVLLKRVLDMHLARRNAVVGGSDTSSTPPQA